MAGIPSKGVCISYQASGQHESWVTSELFTVSVSGTYGISIPMPGLIPAPHDPEPSALLTLYPFSGKVKP